jgi:hypothetical protein
MSWYWAENCLKLWTQVTLQNQLKHAYQLRILTEVFGWKQSAPMIAYYFALEHSEQTDRKSFLFDKKFSLCN